MNTAAKIGVILVIGFALLQLTSFSSSAYNPSNNIKEQPEFFVLKWEKGTELTPKETGITFEVDSIGQHEVVLLVDKNDKPRLFASDISTPVCADGECKLMHIKLYWTLLGEYAGFDRYPGLPLTKHDHDLFILEDYEKLHRLLLDDRSILERRTIDRLVEKPIMREVNGVDALSGATITEVKESVVSGALYSCYVAWHLVHGEIQDSIRTYSAALVNDDMLLHMLKSNNADYQLFALNELDETQYKDNYQRIAEIFKTGIPMVRGVIIKNLHESFWVSKELQKPFWNAFGEIDLNSRSFLLAHLDNASDTVLTEISSNLGVMSKNQLKVFLANLEKFEEINPVLKHNLQDFSKSDNESYSYLVHQFLEDR